MFGFEKKREKNVFSPAILARPGFSFFSLLSRVARVAAQAGPSRTAQLPPPARSRSPSPLPLTDGPHLSGSPSTSGRRPAYASGPSCTVPLPVALRRAPPLPVDPSARANPHAEDPPPHHSRSAPASDPTPPLHACLARTRTRVGRGHASPGILDPHVETDHGAL